MKTQIKRHGGSTVIVLNREFLHYHDLQIGDWLDLSDVTKTTPSNIQLKREVEK